MPAEAERMAWVTGMGAKVNIRERIGLGGKGRKTQEFGDGDIGERKGPTFVLGLANSDYIGGYSRGSTADDDWNWGRHAWTCSWDCSNREKRALTVDMAVQRLHSRLYISKPQGLKCCILDLDESVEQPIARSPWRLEAEFGKRPFSEFRCSLTVSWALTISYGGLGGEKVARSRPRRSTRVSDSSWS